MRRMVFGGRSMNPLFAHRVEVCSSGETEMLEEWEATQGERAGEDD